MLFGDGVLGVFLGEADGFAGALAQKVELGASCFTAFCCLDIDDVRRMEREDSFNTFICNEPADGEGFANAGAFSRDNSAAEDLDALLVAFHDFIRDVD